MRFVIRKYTALDLPAIMNLISEFAAFQKTAEKVTNSVDQMLRDGNLFQCFVAENETKQIVAFASYFFAYYSWTGKAIYLDDLYVTALYRQQGIGSALMEAIFEFARKENCKKVRWQVSNWNTKAIQFYKKMGAVIDEAEINCDVYIG